MIRAPGQMGVLGPSVRQLDAALLPVLLGTGFLLSCFPPECACFLDLMASNLGGMLCQFQQMDLHRVGQLVRGSDGWSGLVSFQPSGNDRGQ